MKKTILGIILTIAVLIAMVGNVNAAVSVSANKTAVKTGEKVEVKVSIAEPSDLQFEVTYKAADFKLLEVKAEEGMDVITGPADLKEANGSVTVMVTDIQGLQTTDHVVLVFEALKDTTEEGTNIVVSNFESTGGETLENGTVNVVVSKPATDIPGTDEPGADEPGTDEPGADEPGTDSDDPHYNQTGAPVYAGIAAVIVVAGAILLVRKVRK